MNDITTFVTYVESLLKGSRLPISHEDQLQESIAQILHQEKLPYIRELAFGGDRLDFALMRQWPKLVALEVKITASVQQHLRQLKRYADIPEIEAVVLLRPKPCAVPKTLSGKPCFCINYWENLFG